MIQHWIQPLVWLALTILAMMGIYIAIRVGSRAYYRSRAEYESEKKMAEKAKEEP